MNKKAVTIKTPFGKERIGKNDDIGDTSSRLLDKVKKHSEAMNAILSGLNDWMQSDMTEDEREQINNPKEYWAKQKLKNQQKEMNEKLSTPAINVLKNCTVDGLIVRLPEGQLERDIYLEVKKRLELIGGKWKGGKIGGFIFQEDPQELLTQVCNGEKRDLKKEFQFFGTPDALADHLVELAELGDEPGLILEPSAGQGAIVKAINRATGGHDIYCYELMPLNQTILKKISTVIFMGEDFLKHHPAKKFNYIIANPPFSKNQDIDHIRKMYECLKPNGRLVSIASGTYENRTQKKQKAFYDWLMEVGAITENIERGSFKESGTSVGGVIIIIDK